MIEAVFTRGAIESFEQRVARIVDERVAELGLTGPRRRWRTVDEAADHLGVTPGAIRKRIKRGQLRATRQGTRLYVDLDAMTSD